MRNTRREISTAQSTLSNNCTKHLIVSQTLNATRGISIPNYGGAYASCIFIKELLKPEIMTRMLVETKLRERWGKNTNTNESRKTRMHFKRSTVWLLRIPLLFQETPSKSVVKCCLSISVYKRCKFKLLTEEWVQKKWEKIIKYETEESGEQS